VRPVLARARDTRPVRLRTVKPAAGEEIAPDDPAWTRYQLHRMDAAIRAGRAPLPLAWERKVRLTAAADSMGSAEAAEPPRARMLERHVVECGADVRHAPNRRQQ
jgi:hypothetical protein